MMSTAAGTKKRRYKPSRAGKERPRKRKDDAHVSRPMNPFFVWQKEQRQIVQQRCPHLQNHMVSIELGRLWKTKIDPANKNAFNSKAKRFGDVHKQMNPDYKYRPRNRNRTSKKNHAENFPLSPLSPPQSPPQCSGQWNLYKVTDDGQAHLGCKSYVPGSRDVHSIEGLDNWLDDLLDECNIGTKEARTNLTKSSITLPPMPSNSEADFPLETYLSPCNKDKDVLCTLDTLFASI